MHIPSIHVLALSAALFASPGHALSVQDYEHMKTAAPDSARSYVDGLGDAYHVANVLLEGRQQKPLFCAPARDSPTSDALADLADKWIRRQRQAGNRLQSTDMEFALINALIEAYPCAVKQE